MRRGIKEAFTGTALATTIGVMANCSFEIPPVIFPDGGNGSDFMDAGRNDLQTTVEDMAVNFDRAVGDVLAREDQGETILDSDVKDLTYSDLVSIPDLARPDMFNFMNCVHTGSDVNFTDNGGHIDQTCKGKALICECPNDPNKDAGVYTVHACPGECAE